METWWQFDVHKMYYSRHNFTLQLRYNKRAILLVIPPSNSWILNTHKEIFIQIEFILILNVWWFNNPAPVELRGSHAWEPQFHLQTLEF
jgi:hypothetical protein